MPCARFEGTETAERYVAGAMQEAEQAAFEEHFFACDACLADVRLLQDVQTGLAAMPVRTASARPPRTRVWTGLAAAAVIVLASGLWLWWRDTAPHTTPAATPQAALPPAPSTPPETPPPTPPATSRETRLAQLAVVTPPPYFPLTTRGGAESDRAAFDAAMTHYTNGRHADAARALGALVERSPSLVHAWFFLGITQLVTGDSTLARRSLMHVVTSGVSPFADEAHFYLAKAALAERDVVTATEELKKAIDLDAGPDGEAVRMLESLRAQ